MIHSKFVDERIYVVHIVEDTTDCVLNSKECTVVAALVELSQLLEMESAGEPAVEL